MPGLFFLLWRVGFWSGCLETNGPDSDPAGDDEAIDGDDVSVFGFVSMPGQSWLLLDISNRTAPGPLLANLSSAL